MKLMVLAAASRACRPNEGGATATPQEQALQGTDITGLSTGFDVPKPKSILTKS